MSSPLVRIAGSFIVGILLGNAFLFFPLTSFGAAACALILSVRMVRRNAVALSSFLLASAVILAGALAIVTAVTRIPADHYRRSSALDGTLRTISGRIASPLERGPERTVFVLAADAIDGRPVSGNLRASVRSTSVDAGYGDRISVRGRLFPPRGSRNPGGFDYPAHLSRQEIEGVVSIRRSDGISIVKGGAGPIRLVQDLRERIRRAFLRSTSGDGSAVLQAMVLGEEGGLTDDLRDRFMAAGVTHILSISGSHLGLVAVMCFWVCRQMLFLLPEKRYHWLTIQADPKKTAAALTVLPVTFYAFLAGGEVATVRALIMILSGLAAVLLDREGDLLSALALAALITLVPAPRALFDISFQLSYLSVVTIAFVVRTWNRLQPHPAGPYRRWMHRAALLLLISASASVATGPLVAYHFRKISLAGIAANMIAVPFAGAVVVPLGLLTGVLSLFTGELPLASFDQAAADAFVGIVSFFSRIPCAAIPVRSPSPLFLASFICLVLSAAFWTRARLLGRFRPLEFSSRPARWIPPTAAASLFLLLAAVLVPLFGQEDGRITFLDVGQGDCALVQSRSGKTVLIDGGGTRDGRFDVGRRIVAPYLRDNGVRRLDLVVLSHPHPDHVNGLVSLAREFPIGALWWSGLDTGLEDAVALQRALAGRNVPLRAVAAGETAVLDEISLEVLHPAREFRSQPRPAYAAENDRSLVVLLRMSGKTLLFSGDLHSGGEAALLRLKGRIGADTLKVPHHGSKSSSSGEFIRAVGPADAVISAGSGNPYGHPSPEVLARYRAAGAEIFRTDRDGAVLMRSGRHAWTTFRWSDLELRTIDVVDSARWGTGERENWERVWIRTRGI